MIELPLNLIVERIALVLQIATACGLAGIAWYRQIVQYPLLRRIDRRSFRRYMQPLGVLDAMVVGPLLVVDLLASFVLVVVAVHSAEVFLLFAGAGLSLCALSVALFPVRRHMRATAREFSPRSYRRLFCWHWIFSVLCSLHGIVVLFIVVRSISL